MRCRRVQELIRDGELTGEARAHIAECPSCRRVYLLWQEVKRGLSLPAPAAPPGFKDRVMAQLSAPEKEAGRSPGRLRLVLAVAAGLLVMAGSAWAFFKGTFSPPPPAPPPVVADRSSGSSTPVLPDKEKVPGAGQGEEKAGGAEAPEKRQSPSPGASLAPAPAEGQRETNSPGARGEASPPRAGAQPQAELPRAFLSHPQLARSGFVELRVADVARAKGQVRNLARQFGAQENHELPVDGGIELAFALPSSQGEAFVKALCGSGIGSVQDRWESSRDVTQQLAELKARCEYASPEERRALEGEVKKLEADTVLVWLVAGR
ncbi:hypothetical protein Adeg_2156 (plasmid) [Ammonifex degensii KC4]|uniref:DUF4349 domain-containing protein n=1 Tax=Ammonifex degensii (strain DSM 10501 / KC4) TaxID=429009 RepID=C9RDG2_AMMDK|nr:DUF4349 domain-containing protein [Ammonifex degensii]ACX53233.1 hypothetical protein Adeg_2156 [Ammonifex degensii KC4]